MMSPFLTKMRKSKAEKKFININLNHFKDVVISHLIAIRAVDGEIIDIDFGMPGKGCVGIDVYINPKEEKDVEDQVDSKKRGKKR